MQQHADWKRVCSKLPDVLRWTKGRIRRQQLWFSNSISLIRTGQADRDDLLHERRPGALRPSERERQSRNAFDISVHRLVSNSGFNTGDRRFEHRANTLEFSNPIVGSWAPDFDQIQFNCPTLYLGNISTRSFVQTGDNVMIGGFIGQGTHSKRVILRAIGPELSQYGVPDLHVRSNIGTTQWHWGPDRI